MKNELVELAEALRADPAGAVSAVLERSEALLADPGSWQAFFLSVAEALALVGLGDAVVLGLVDRIGPVPGAEEDWRVGRIRVLSRLAAWSGDPALITVEIGAALVDAGVERGLAVRIAHHLAQGAAPSLAAKPLVLVEPELRRLAAIHFERGGTRSEQ